MLSQDDQRLVGAAQKHRDMHRAMPVTVSGVSFCSSFWIVATFVILSGLIVAGGFPNWIQNEVQPGTQARSLGNALQRVDLGIYYLCYKLRGCGDPNSDACEDECRQSRACGCYLYMHYDPPTFVNSTDSILTESGMVPYENYSDLVFLFSGSIVYAFGCLLLFISLIVGAIAYFKPKIGHCSLFLFAFVLQAVAGIAIIVGLALVPVFFGADFAHQFCGSAADYYVRGQCNMDWALFVAMVVTACSLYLPALAIFSMNKSDGLNAHICC